MGVTQKAMAGRIGVTRGPLQAIERGESKRVTSTIRAYAREVGWEEGSIDRVLRGEDPVTAHAMSDSSPPEPDNPHVDNAHYAAGMPARIMFEISDGQVLDTDVIDLSAPGSDTKLVLIAKMGASGASDEQKRSDLLRWARIQRRFRQVVDEELSNP